MLLVLSAVTLITLDERGGGRAVVDVVREGARDAAAPVQSAARSAMSPVGNLLDGIAHSSDLEAENARLRRQLEAARSANIRAAEAEATARELARLNNLPFVKDIPSVSSQVVGGATSNFDLTVVLDRGRDDGVLTGMPVVSGDGLVGHVVESSRTRATVLLASDPASNVGVMFSRTREVGVAGGAGAGQPLRVDFVGPKAEVKPGDLVVTSGQQTGISRFPGGIPVGTVTTAEVAKGALAQDVSVKPVVDLARLTFVKVLLWSPS